MPPTVSSHSGPNPTPHHGFSSARGPRQPSLRRLIAIGIGTLWGLLWCLVAGTCVANEAGLDAPVTATWSGLGLREWAARISATAGRPVLVDRRLDPDTAIRLECRDEPLVDVLGRGAAAADGELAALASSIWIVPRGRADVTLRAEAARTATIAALPPRQRSLLLGKQPWQWPAGARPRDLVAACAAAEQIRLEAIDSVPHDHLPAVSLPAMTLAERLDLILAPYDLRVDWQSTSSTARGRADAAITGRLIAIDRGLPPVAATAARSTNSKPPGRRVSAKPQPAAAEQTFSLRVAAPLEEVLAAIAMRLGVAVALDRESLTQAGISPQEIVRATITNASRDDLLDAILAPLKLHWKIDGTTLRVFASSDRP